MLKKSFTVLVGAGYWGSKILEKLVFLDLNIIVLESNSKTLSIYKKKYNDKKCIFIKNFHDLKKLDYENVIIASPAQLHFQQINYFLKLSKNIFVEKPLCINFEQIKLLKKKLHNYKKTFMVGHIMHHHNSFKKIVELKKKNFFGKILYLYSSRLSFGKLRKFENILSSFAPHDLSMMIALMKKAPIVKNCSGSKMLNNKVYDNSIINLKFSKKVNAHIFVNWLSPFKEQKFVVIGEKNMLVFDDTAEWDKKIMIINKPLIVQNNSYVLNNKKISFLKTKKNDALLDEIKYFCKCAKNKSKPISGIDESFHIYGLLDKSIKILKK